MNPRRNDEKTARTWTYRQAEGAVPYIAAVMRSLRETWLEGRTQQRRLDVLAARPGQPDRRALLAHAEAVRAVGRAQQAQDDAVQELQALGVLDADPHRGVALVPCVHHHALAWIVFDLFTEPHLRAWRYQGDPPDVERSIVELIAEAAQEPIPG
jgi:hypothetical protein